MFPKADATQQPGREMGKIVGERLSRPDANSFSVKGLQITPDPKLQSDSPLDLAGCHSQKTNNGLRCVGCVASEFKTVGLASP